MLTEAQKSDICIKQRKRKAQLLTRTTDAKSKRLQNSNYQEASLMSVLRSLQECLQFGFKLFTQRSS